MVAAGNSAASHSAGSQIAVIGKAGLVLDELLGLPDGATPSEVASQLGLNRSTTFRLLTSLELAGLLDRDAASGRYRLGVKMLAYAESVRDSHGLVRLAEPVMRELREQTGQSVYLSVRDGWTAVCLHRLAGAEVDVLAWQTGQRLPLHAGAGPLALLAAAGDAELAGYLAAASRPVTRRGELTPASLRRIVATTRSRGWSLNVEGLTEGVASVGAAVLDRSGTALCALSLAGLARHYQGRGRDRMAAAVLAAAARLTGSL